MVKKAVWEGIQEYRDSLAHGNQEDFTDCGILMTNTAAHDMFHDAHNQG